MMQVLLQVPGTPIKLFGFGVFFCLAMLAAMYLAAWRAPRNKLSADDVLDLAFWVFLGGLVGARLFFVLQYRQKFDSPWQMLEVWKGGIVFYGGLIGGVLAGLIYWWRRRFPLLPMFDLVAPSIAVGIALGRLGCFFNGCCYGDRCELPWAVSFPQQSIPWWDQVRDQLPEHLAEVRPLDLPVQAVESVLAEEPALHDGSLPVHPTQLYSVADGLILAGLLLAFHPLRRRDGQVIALFMIAYPIDRFLIEWLRNDEGAVLAGMTISQLISIPIVVGGIGLWAWLRGRPAQLHVDAEPVPTS